MKQVKKIVLIALIGISVMPKIAQSAAMEETLRAQVKSLTDSAKVAAETAKGLRLANKKYKTYEDDRAKIKLDSLQAFAELEESAFFAADIAAKVAELDSLGETSFSSDYESYKNRFIAMRDNVRTKLDQLKTPAAGTGGEPTGPKREEPIGGGPVPPAGPQPKPKPEEPIAGVDLTKQVEVLQAVLKTDEIDLKKPEIKAALAEAGVVTTKTRVPSFASIVNDMNTKVAGKDATAIKAEDEANQWSDNLKINQAIVNKGVKISTGE